MKRLLLLLPLLLLCAAEPALSQAPPPDPVFGIWANPKKTIAVRIAPCGQQLCGTIVLATAKALNDARGAGVDHLVGTELLRDYRRTGPTRWSGTVYVPDMGRSFSSHIVEVTPGTLRISGCLLGGWICKSQDWTPL